MTEITKALNRPTSRRGLLSTGAATAIAGGCLLASVPSFSGPAETEVARLHRLLEQRKAELADCCKLAEQGPSASYDDAVGPAYEAKWSVEDQIIDAQAVTPADARIQLTVLRDHHEGCDYHTENINHVIASVLAALS